jgi:hypothetical protein
MIRRYLLVGTAFIWLFQVSGNGAPGDGVPNESQERARNKATDPALQEAADIMRLPRTTKLDIFVAPVGHPLAPLTPESLERQPEYRISVEPFGPTKLREELISAVETSFVRRVEDLTPDYRWGLVFYDIEGKRVLTMYFTLWGDHGLINDTLVITDRRIMEVLRKRCSPLWK